MPTSAENITAISFVSSAHASSASDANHQAAFFFRFGSRPLRNAAKADAANIVTIVSEAAETHVTGSM